MNSWRSIEFAACAPPLITFSIGTGSVAAASPPRWRYSGSPASAAAAFATASEAPRIAFAPSRPLFGVPSRSISVRSTPAWSPASIPATARSTSMMFATAVATPLPPQAEPPSRNSIASWTPVEAPEGTAARPKAPDSSCTSTSTVGFPRESRIWRPRTCAIAVIRSLPSQARSTGPARRAAASPTPRPARAPAAPPARRAARSVRSSPAAPARDRR
jgi:hypothetical protein